MSCGNTKQQLERAGINALAICTAPYKNSTNEIVNCNCPFSEHRDEAAPGRNMRERFEELLRQGGITRPNQNIMDRLHKLNNSVFISASTPNDAVYWYEWTKVIPKTATRERFLNVTGYQLDGMHPQFDGILLAGDDKGQLYMFKQRPHDSNEIIFASRVNGMPFVVASSYQYAETVDATGETHSCGGLLMRKFETSLSGNEFQCSISYLLLRCKSMIIAINSMHTEGIVHMDLKETNIFVRSGVWFVGDFGSCVNHGDPIRETTGGCYVLTHQEIIGTPARWHHDWFAMTLVLVNQLRVHEGPIDFAVAGFRDRVIAAIHANCEEVELKTLLLRMVDCEEQCMHFEGEGDFETVTDDFNVGK